MNTQDQGVLFQCVVLTCFLVYPTVNSQSACGGTLTSLAGAIQSPNFPNNYTNGLSCIYVIKPNSKGVTLTFTSFDLEHESACGYDYVEVRAGDSESSPKLGRYCGMSLPGPLRTSGNRMWVKFVTGSSVTRRGFRAIYTPACGATLTSLTGVIQSPNFPSKYPNELGCVYVISVPDTYRVTLTFTNFDVENSTDCKYDYVEVRDGDSESSPPLGQYCGTSLPGPLRMSGNRMWIKFVTGSRVTRPGFSANYTSETGQTALNVPLIGGVVAGVIVVVVVVVIIVVFVFMKRRDPQHVKPGKRQNRTPKEPHSDPRTENNQPAVTNRACSVSSISARPPEPEDDYLQLLNIPPTPPRKPPIIPPRRL